MERIWICQRGHFIFNIKRKEEELLTHLTVLEATRLYVTFFNHQICSCQPQEQNKIFSAGISNPCSLKRKSLKNNRSELLFYLRCFSIFVAYNCTFRYRSKQKPDNIPEREREREREEGGLKEKAFTNLITVNYSCFRFY